jgi:lysozyme family protein
MNTKPLSPLFLHAAGHILDLEGGYVNHAADNGGPTNFGISDNRDGKKDGLIDLDGDGKGDIAPARLTKEQALAIYHRDYWLPCRCDDLPPAIAIAVFDHAVNSGVERAAKLLQRKLKVLADGSIGPVTIKAAHARNTDTLLLDLFTARAWLYHSIVASNSSQTVFLEGWFARLFKLQQFILSFPTPMTFYTKPTP